jgi:protein ImuB
VVDGNAAALAAGIRSGMTLAEARARLPALAVAEADPGGDEAALARLGDWAIRFGPAVHLLPPGAVAVEVGGSAHLFGGERRLAERAVAALGRRGFRAAAAVAATIGAAYALATEAESGEAIIVPSGEEARALGPLSVAALRVDESEVRRLGTLGVRRIADLLALDRADLKVRFGEPLVRRIAEALGDIEEPLPLHVPGHRFRAALAFAEPIDGGEPLFRGVRRLVDEAADWLAARLEGARRLVLEIAEEGEEARRAVEVGLGEPAREARRLGALVRVRLEEVRLRGRVAAIALEVAETAPLPYAQRRFAGEEARGERDRRGALDCLAARLGDRAVLRAELADDHRPERAFRLRAVTRARAAAGKGATALDPPEPRPVRLLGAPRPIEVVSEGDGAPRAVRPAPGAVAVVRGPERLGGAWWAGGEARDYYEVEAADGRRLWIFFAPAAGRWFLHGLF